MHRHSKRLIATAFIAAFFIFCSVFLSGCASGSSLTEQPSQQQAQTVKIIYVCPDGSEVSAKADCALQPANTSTPSQPPEPSKNTSSTSNGLGWCSPLNSAACGELSYCRAAEGAKMGSCEKMVPVGLSLSPPGAYYDYSLGGAWTGSFTVLNTGNTPIALNYVSNSKYVSVVSSNATYLESGAKANVKYRVHFDDAGLPVGTSILSVSVTSPVKEFVVQDFKITVSRAY